MVASLPWLKLTGPGLLWKRRLPRNPRTSKANLPRHRMWTNLFLFSFYNMGCAIPKIFGAILIIRYFFESWIKLIDISLKIYIHGSTCTCTSFLSVERSPEEIHGLLDFQNGKVEKPSTWFGNQVWWSSCHLVPQPHDPSCQDTLHNSTTSAPFHQLALPRRINSLKTQIQKVDDAYGSCMNAWSKGEAEGFFTEGLLSLLCDEMHKTLQNNWMKYTKHFKAIRQYLNIYIYISSFILTYF